MKFRRKPDTALKTARRAVAARDEGVCLVCGKPADDIAHVLPKGRYPELQTEMQNLVALCRDCHLAHECVAGRSILLQRLTRTYGYGYEDEPYRSYFEL
jgi:hypothetical protein